MANEWRPSIHLMSGSAKIQACLLIVAGVMALALVVGYRTRVATALSWVLLLSLHTRNELILHGGDSLLLLMLFWSLFLPLGARFSVDAALEPDAPRSQHHYFSVATMAFLLQMMFVYFFGALHKTDPMWIPDGTAVYHTLQLDFMTTPFGVWLGRFEGLLRVITYSVWGLELLGPILVFSPLWNAPIRLVVLVLLTGTHLGFVACMNLGLFPWVSILSLVAFLPRSFWDAIEARIRTPERLGLTLIHAPGAELSAKACRLMRAFLLFPDTPIVAPGSEDAQASLPEGRRWALQESDGTRFWGFDALVRVFRHSPIFWPFAYLFVTRPTRRLGERVYEALARRPHLEAWLDRVLVDRAVRLAPLPGMGLVVGALLVFAACINIVSLPAVSYRLPQPLPGIARLTGLQQQWNMFAPPSKADGWYVVAGELEDGRVVDVVAGIGSLPTFEKPAYVSQMYSSYRWRKYLRLVSHVDYHQYRPAYASYLCRSWNRDHRGGAGLKELKIYFNLERTLPNYQVEEVERLLLEVRQCSSSAGESQATS